eukprot:10682993-Karenia_brevis.AAC.1
MAENTHQGHAKGNAEWEEHNTHQAQGMSSSGQKPCSSHRPASHNLCTLPLKEMRWLGKFGSGCHKSMLPMRDPLLYIP